MGKSSAGGGVHRVFPDLPRYRGGLWTPDETYFVFAGGERTWDIWAVRTPKRVLALGSRAPVRLTFGLMQAVLPVITPDGKRIVFEGLADRGELVRYDSTSAQWISDMSGLSATQVDYSPDRKWMAYIAYPAFSIWRSARTVASACPSQIHLCKA